MTVIDERIGDSNLEQLGIESSASASASTPQFDLETHARRIKQLADKASLCVGDTWYVISSQWWNSWKSFVEQNAARSSISVDKPPPGVIDNGAIIDENKNLNEPWLRPNLIESMDYILVPFEAWNELKTRFGLKDGQELPRQVIEMGMFRKQSRVELYPLDIYVRLAADDTNVQTLVLSRSSTLDYLRTTSMSALHIVVDCDRVQFYLEHPNDEYKYEHLDFGKHGTSAPLEDLVGPGAKILVDVLDETGNGSIDSSKIMKIVPQSSSSLPAFGSSAPASGVPANQLSRWNPRTVISYVFVLLPLALMSGGLYLVTDYVARFWRSVMGSLLGIIGCDSSSYSYSPVTRSYFGDSERNDNYTPGLCGLQNLGNTCFMNSALQCLSNVPELCQYFTSDEYKGEINEKNPLGMHGRLAKAYGELVKNMWSGGHRSVLPREFKIVVGQFAPTFSGYQQQDSQELMSFLLDGLHEDLNRIRDKPYIEEKDGDGRPDKEVALEAWNNYKKRNDSIIVDQFHGQLKSTLVCPECAKVSIKFDPFCYLSLPLPTREKGRAVQLTFVPLDTAKDWTKIQVFIPKFGKVSEFLDAVSELVGVDSVLLTMGNASSGRLAAFPRSNEMATRIGCGMDSIYVWQVQTIKEESVMIWAIQRLKPSEKSFHLQYVGIPICLRLPKSQLNAPHIRSLIKQRLEKMFVEEFPEAGSKWWIEDDAEAEGDDSGVEENGDKGNDKETPMDTTEDREDTSETASAGARPIFKLTFASSTNSTTSSPEPIDPKTCYNSSTGFPDDPLMYAFIDWDPQGYEKFFNTEYESNIAAHESTAPKKKDIELGDCLDMFTKEEKLGEHDLWYCPQCKDFRQASKKLELWNLPDVLIVHLKRFQYTRWYRDKIESVIEFPIRKLDLMPWIKNPDHPSTVYDLIAVSNHMGGLGGGHYTAYAMNASEGAWYTFDDSHVSSLGKGNERSHLISRNAYVLFYQRRQAVTHLDPNMEIEDFSD